MSETTQFAIGSANGALVEQLCRMSNRHGRIAGATGTGKTITLQTYAQTGQGVLPIHYLLDDRGWPQLVTNSILSWSLSG